MASGYYLNISVSIVVLHQSLSDPLQCFNFSL